MSLFDDLIANETLAAVKAKIVAYAQGAQLEITDWVVGGVGEQIYQAFALGVYTYASLVPRIARGFVSLDTSTDPGDPDDYDAGNEALDAEPGYLSALGANTFGTERGEATFATGLWTMSNAGPGARTFSRGALTFTWTVTPPTGNAPTYRNDVVGIYDSNGNHTLAAGASVDVGIVAEEIGSRSNAPPGAITLTTTLVGVTGTNAASVLGTDREDADVYRRRCRQAPARISLGGPAAAYEYLAAKNLDGTPLLNASDAEVNITRVQVSQSSATGVVVAKYASDSGAASGPDVTAANANIESECFAVPDAITFTGSAASALVIHVVGTARIKAKAGVTVAAVRDAIVAALVAAFKEFPIGGVDQDGDGDGVIYTNDLQAIAAGAYPGLYDVVVTTPATATTALTFGRVATPNTVAGDWTVTIV